jgi:hypothetical protein
MRYFLHGGACGFAFCALLAHSVFLAVMACFCMLTAGTRLK